jgi:hypothetical protein
MSHLFANYELSLLAKEKGFDEPCFRVWIRPRDLTIKMNMVKNFRGLKNSEDKMERVTVPLYQQLCDWFREKHNIHILSDVTFDKKNGNWYYYGIYTKNKLKKYSDGDFKPEHALNKAIKEAFKLI